MSKVQFLSRFQLRNFFSRMFVATTIALTAWASASHAAIPQKPSDWLIKDLKGDGFLTGGRAGSGFSLLALDLIPRTKSELIKVQLGDRNGMAMKTPPGYHHVQYSKKGMWVQIDFSQMARSLVESKMVKEKFKASKFVRQADLTLDPEDGSYNLRLLLKRPVHVRTAIAKGKPNGELYIEILPE